MAPTPETKLTAGVMLGPYRVESKLGQGGMGEVWKAHDTRLGRSVAIKVSAAQFSERFNREARAVAALNHPNICTLYDVGPNYLVMELVEGHVPKGPLPLEKALHYARQIADALQAAHEKGIIHRDLKPANLKITPDGTVKVLDFGLAKTIHATSPPTEDDATQTAALTAAGAILGTAPYMSPEQAEGKPSDKRADICDGRRVAVARANAQTSAKVEIQMLDLTPARATRFTSAAYANLPVWSPDGNRIIFHSQALNGGVEMYQKPATGSSDQARLLPSTGEPASALSWARPTSFSPDGRYLLYESSSPNKQWDLWSVSLDPPSKPVPFLQTGGNDQDGQFSPQGRWVAYTSDESGREEVYLRTFPEAGESVPVSSTGGHSPRWRADGQELFYLAADGKLMSVEITPGRESHPSTPKPLFQANAVLPSWSVSADGQRFLFAIPTQQNTQPVFTVVLNWMAALKN